MALMTQILTKRIMTLMMRTLTMQARTMLMIIMMPMQTGMLMPVLIMDADNSENNPGIAISQMVYAQVN